jgi:hypothetical protein
LGLILRRKVEVEVKYVLQPNQFSSAIQKEGVKDNERTTHRHHRVLRQTLSDPHTTLMVVVDPSLDAAYELELVVAETAAFPVN